MKAYNEAAPKDVEKLEASVDSGLVQPLVSKAEYEDKFIVINVKRFNELSDKLGWEFIGGDKMYCKPVRDFIDALDKFAVAYTISTGKLLDQRYFVCNQDEPYAEKVKDTILEGEANKSC